MEESPLVVVVVALCLRELWAEKRRQSPASSASNRQQATGNDQRRATGRRANKHTGHFSHEYEGGARIVCVCLGSGRAVVALCAQMNAQKAAVLVACAVVVRRLNKLKKSRRLRRQTKRICALHLAQQAHRFAGSQLHCTALERNKRRPWRRERKRKKRTESQLSLAQNWSELSICIWHLSERTDDDDDVHRANQPNKLEVSSILPNSPSFFYYHKI